jgi:hypothetical protein
MAATGFTPIQLYRTATASATPSAGNLADGELAINTNDEKLYFKNSSGVVKALADGPGAGVYLPLAGGALTGAVTTNSTFDGRDVAADGVTADAALPKAGGALSGDVTNTSTGSFQVSQGTTAQRPAGTATGRLRYNSTDAAFEGYTAAGWGEIGGGGPSLGTDSVIRTNAKVIAENITFAGTENGSTVGPITINASYTVTVTTGSTWIIL